MEKVGLLRIAAGVAGMLMLHVEGREVLDAWFGQRDDKGIVIRPAGMPDAVKPDHGPHRDAAGQRLELTRATQVATPSAMIFFGSPESPKRI